MTPAVLQRHPDDAVHLPQPGPAGPGPRLRAATDGLLAWTARWWTALVGGLLLAVSVDLVADGPWLRGWDLAAHAWAAHLPHSRPYELTGLVLDHVGQRYLVTPILLAGAWWAHRRTRSWSSLWLVLGTIFVMNLILAASKFGLARGLSVDGNPSFFLPMGQAFPSGHACNAASAAALGVVLWTRATGRHVRYRTAVVVVAAYSALMSAISLYLGFHWLSDLVAGAMLGALVVRGGVAVEGWWHRTAARRAWIARRDALLARRAGRAATARSAARRGPGSAA